MKRFANVLSFAVMALAVTACTTVSDPSKSAGVVDGRGGVQTAGLGEEDYGYGSDTMVGKRCTRRVENQTYYFDYDSSAIHSGDRASVDVQGNYLASHPSARVVLEGHTDPRGSREYNVALGERRARSVSEALKMDGADANQIRIVSYGAEKLATPGHTEEDYQLDRRVNLVYEAK